MVLPHPAATRLQRQGKTESKVGVVANRNWRATFSWVEFVIVREMRKFRETTRRLEQLQRCGQAVTPIRRRLQRTNHSHSNVNHPETESWLGHSSSLHSNQTCITGGWAANQR
jgi:hypothetical protein